MLQVMNRILLLTILAVLITANGIAQTAANQTSLTDQQWRLLFRALEGEDWDNAEKLSSKYLDETHLESKDNTVARLRYMYLYSAAGKIAAGKMSYEDLENRIKDFAGKHIFLPARYLKQKCNGGVDFNAICKSDGPHDIMVTSANSTATTIHAFEYIKLKEKLDWSKNDGKVAAITGRIESIVPNPNKSRALIMRIYVVDANIQLSDAPDK